MDDVEERVRERAYRLWEEEGCPQGQAETHWDKARELVAIELNYKLAMQPVGGEPKLGPYGEPIEPIEAVENTGEFPTLVDQGEEQTYPRRPSPKLAGE
jgi:hypothetical protein